MPQNRLNPMNLLRLYVTGVSLLSRARGASALPPDPNLTSPCSPAPLPAFNAFQADAFLAQIGCVDCEEPPTAQTLEIQQPGQRTQAAQLANGTRMGGCALSSYTLPLTVEGQEEPLLALFDTGSPSVGVVGEDAEVMVMNSTLGVLSNSTEVPWPYLEAGHGLIETNATASTRYVGTSWSGDMVQGNLSLPGLPKVPAMRFARITEGASMVTQDWCAQDAPQLSNKRGIIGMGTVFTPGANYGDAFLTKMRAQQPDFSFSFAPCHTGANVFWGPPPAEHVDGPLLYAQAQNGTNAYAATLQYVELGSTRIAASQKAASPTPMIFDTGAPAMMLPQSVLQAVALEMAVQTGAQFWGQIFGTNACIPLPANVSLAQIDAVLPKLTLGVVASNTTGAPTQAKPAVHRLTLAASSYLLPTWNRNGTAVLCPGIAGSSFGLFSVNAMIGQIVHFDDANLRIGIGHARGTCV